MGKLIGLGLFVGVIWVSLEFYTQGTNGAFGGVFGDGSIQIEAPSRKTGKAAVAVKDAYAEGADRVDRMLEE